LFFTKAKIGRLKKAKDDRISFMDFL